MKPWTYGTCLLLAVVFWGCSKSEINNSNYPDCFEDKSATHEAKWGCGSIVARIQFGATRLLNIRLDEAELGVTTDCQTFSIADHPQGIQIALVTHANHPDSIYYDYCNDAISPVDIYGELVDWPAQSGELSVAISNLAEDREDLRSFLVSMEISNLVVRHPVSGVDTTFETIVLKDVTTGYTVP